MGVKSSSQKTPHLEIRRVLPLGRLIVKFSLYLPVSTHVRVRVGICFQEEEKILSQHTKGGKTSA